MSYSHVLPEPELLATPWAFERSSRHEWIIRDAKGLVVALCTTRFDAERIVSAVNERWPST